MDGYGYVFPYMKIDKGSQIIIWGAGQSGNCLHKSPPPHTLNQDIIQLCISLLLYAFHNLQSPAKHIRAILSTLMTEERL